MDPATRRATVLKLIKYFQREEHADPTYLDIEDESGQCPRTIAKKLRELEASQDLRVERRAGCRNHYIIQEEHHATQDQSSGSHE